MSFRYNEKEQSSILKLTDYFSRERDAGVPLLPLNAVYNRVADALEIYIRTVQKLATSGMETDKDYKIKVHARDVSARGSSIYIIHQYAIRTRVYAMYSAEVQEDLQNAAKNFLDNVIALSQDLQAQLKKN